MQPVANWLAMSKIAQMLRVELLSNVRCHFIGIRHHPRPLKIKTKVFFLHLSSWFSKALVLIDFKIRLGKSSEAEKIFEYLDDSPSVSAQSECVAFQRAE